MSAETNAGTSGHEVFDTPDVTALLELALAEDLRTAGDVTARILPEEATCAGRIVFREAAVLAGLPLAERVLARVEPRARLHPHAGDGDSMLPGGVAATVAGPARGVLAAERTLLNFMQRLSGVATATRTFVDAVAGTGAAVLDTRKTIPGWRLLDKYAVRTGGGANHRFGLHDMVLVKDNHLACLGGEAGIAQAIRRAREVAPAGTLVEVEVTTQDGALAACRGGADLVLLDNFSLPCLADAVRAVKADALARGVRPPPLEASGGVNLTTIRSIAETGVDRISVGAITHSARNVDIALDFELSG